MPERKDARWFVRWAVWMQERLVRPDWPTPEMGYWAEMERKFEELGVTEREAMTAVRAMFGTPFFVDQFVKEFTDRLLAERRFASRSASADPGQRAHAEREAALNAAHQAACEAAWATFDEPSRQEWRDYVVRRMPFLAARPKMRELLAMAWSTFPSEIPPERAPRAEDKAVKRVFERPSPAWDHTDPRAAMVLAREEAAREAAKPPPPSPGEIPDESSEETP